MRVAEKFKVNTKSLKNLVGYNRNRVIWFTGLSGSGKTTISSELLKLLPEAVLLDGDVLRKGLCSDLGFSIEDRNENIRRVAEVSKLLYEAGKTVIVAFISPFDEQRLYARSLIPKGDFVLVHLTTSLEECEKRDPKGLYKKARKGLIPEFTGIDSPFEKPSRVEMEFDTAGNLSAKKIAKKIFDESFHSFSRIPHDAFIGRWCPFHKGHFAIIKKVYEKNKRPLLILVRDTSFDKYPADYRKSMVEASMKKMGIPVSVEIIPDIASINWGRGVGYETNFIDIDEELKTISATQIREMINNNEDFWKEVVCEGVAEFIEKRGI